jgi:hypothetical protein
VVRTFLVLASCPTRMTPRPYGIRQDGRGRRRSQGSRLDLPAGRALPCMAQAQAQAHLDRHDHGWIIGAHHLGRLGEAVIPEFRYTHPRPRADVAIRQAVRVPRGEPFEVKIGQRVEVVCWGVMPSGMLRHPLLTPWR